MSLVGMPLCRINAKRICLCRRPPMLAAAAHSKKCWLHAFSLGLTSMRTVLLSCGSSLTTAFASCTWANPLTPLGFCYYTWANPLTPLGFCYYTGPGCLAVSWSQSRLNGCCTLLILVSWCCRPLGLTFMQRQMWRLHCGKQASR